MQQKSPKIKKTLIKKPTLRSPKRSKWTSKSPPQLTTPTHKNNNPQNRNHNTYSPSFSFHSTITPLTSQSPFHPNNHNNSYNTPPQIPHKRLIKPPSTLFHKSIPAHFFPFSSPTTASQPQTKESNERNKNDTHSGPVYSKNDPTVPETSKFMQFKKSIIQAIKPDKPQGILIGELNGDTFHEWFDPRAPPDQLPRRYVEYKDNNNPTPNNIHELWDLWLRHAVWDPPTRDDIDKYELRRNKYLSRVKMMEERDEKVRLEEQLQRKLGSEMGKGVYKGDVNKGSTKQDPMEGVKEFLSGLEQELKQQQDDMKQSAEMFGGGGGGGGSGKNGENQQYEDVTNTWDPTKSRKFDF